MRDSQIEWLRKSHMIYPFGANGLVHDGSTPFNLLGSVSAGITLIEVAASGVMGLQMAADEIMSFAFRIPKDLDPQWPVGFKVHWTLDHDGVDPATASWILLADFLARGGVIAVSSTALDTIIPLLSTYEDTSEDATVVTDSLYQVSARGIKTDIGLTRENIEEGSLFVGNLELDAIANAQGNLGILLALEMDYVPWKTQGEGSFIDRPLQRNGVV